MFVVVHPFTLTFAYSAGCGEEYIEIYERLDCKGYRLAKLCRPFDYRLWYTFENIGCIRYHTGSTTPRERQPQTGLKINFFADDIDECRYGYCQYSDLCENTPGSYQCSCPPGYFLSSNGENCFGEYRESLCCC